MRALFKMTREEVQAIRERSEAIQKMCIDEEIEKGDFLFVDHHLPRKSGTDKHFLDETSWDLSDEEMRFVKEGLQMLEKYHKAFYAGTLESGADILPLWLAFPLYPRDTMGWRMGAGEDYGMKWVSWFGGLSEEEQRKYNEKFPMPDYWAMVGLTTKQ